MGIHLLHQGHYKNAIIEVLKAWGGQAYGHEVINALLNDPNSKIELTAPTDVDGVLCPEHFNQLLALLKVGNLPK